MIQRHTLAVRFFKARYFCHVDIEEIVALRVSPLSFDTLYMGAGSSKLRDLPCELVLLDDSVSGPITD